MSDERAVKVGDRFLRVTIDMRHRGGELVDVVERGSFGPTGPVMCLLKQGVVRATLPERDLITSGHWRRVPPGYVVPPVASLLEGIVRLCAARDAMRADPETGARGVFECIDEMARLAGIEVAT